MPRRRAASPANLEAATRTAARTLDAAVLGGAATCVGALVLAVAGRWPEAFLTLAAGAALALGGAAGRSAWPGAVRRARVALSVGAWGWVVGAGGALLLGHVAAVAAPFLVGVVGVSARGITALWAVERAG